MTQENVLAALSHVKHPAQSANIVQTGMVSEVTIEGDRVAFTLTFPKANDPLIASVEKACRKAILYYIQPDAEIDIRRAFTEAPQPEEEPLHIRHIIAVASGKGGVGKSTVAANIAIGLKHAGYRVGLLDADIYGPSMPIMLHAGSGVTARQDANGKEWIVPADTYGIKMLSIGFFVPEGQAVIWRGPMATGALKQLIHQGDWGELDFLILDMPPGTGDVHITLVNEVKLSGAVIVSTPQAVALADVMKGIDLFRNPAVNVPILGLVENMAWFTPAELPDHKYYLFGREGCKKTAEEQGIPLLAQIPVVQSICEGSDNGTPVALDPDSLTGRLFIDLAEKIADAVEKNA